MAPETVFSRPSSNANFEFLVDNVTDKLYVLTILQKDKFNTVVESTLHEMPLQGLRPYENPSLRIVLPYSKPMGRFQFDPFRKSVLFQDKTNVYQVNLTSPGVLKQIATAPREHTIYDLQYHPAQDFLTYAMRQYIPNDYLYQLPATKIVQLSLLDLKTRSVTEDYFGPHRTGDSLTFGVVDPGSHSVFFAADSSYSPGGSFSQPLWYGDLRLTRLNTQSASAVSLAVPRFSGFSKEIALTPRPSDFAFKTLRHQNPLNCYDTNGDGKVTTADSTLLASRMPTLPANGTLVAKTIPTTECIDVDGNGLANETDASLLQWAVSGTLPNLAGAWYWKTPANKLTITQTGSNLTFAYRGHISWDYRGVFTTRSGLLFIKPNNKTFTGQVSSDGKRIVLSDGVTFTRQGPVAAAIAKAPPRCVYRP